MKKLKNKLNKKETGGCVDENGMEIPCPENTLFPPPIQIPIQTNPLLAQGEGLDINGKPIQKQTAPVNPDSEPVYEVDQRQVGSDNNNINVIPINSEGVLKKTRTNRLNFNHILPSLIAKNLLQGISNMSANSSQNAIKRFNNDQFSPLSYLPGNPNYSKQAYYGMDNVKKGGILFSEGGFLDDFTNGFLNYNEEPTNTQELVKPKKVKKDKFEDSGDEDVIYAQEAQRRRSPILSAESLISLDRMNPDGFKEKIAAVESNGRYDAENPNSSAVGKYQFLWDTWGKNIKSVTGVSSKKDFKKNPDAQEQFMNWYEKNQLNPQVEVLAPLAQGMTGNQLKALVHFKGFGGARTYLTKGEDNTQSHNISIPKYIKSFPDGGIVDPITDWHKQWMQSPMYKKMNEGEEDFTEQRLSALDSVGINFIPPSTMKSKYKTPSSNLGVYDANEHSVNINERVKSEDLINVTKAHEIGHARNKGDKFMSKQDKALVDPEQAALILQARYEAQQQGVYNPFEQPFKEEYLKDAKENGGLRNLLKMLGKDKTVEVMNSVSQNTPVTEPTVAKKGGKVKSYKQGGTYEIDASEYERLKNLGYDIEIIP